MLHNNSDFETTDNDFSSAVYGGSMQRVLNNHLGEPVTVEFLIGTNGVTSKTGILYDVGEKYIVIFVPNTNSYVMGDIFNLKFVTFPQSAQSPRQR